MSASPPDHGAARGARAGRTFHQLARRDQLVACALQVVSRDGVGALSVSSVAREAGVSRGVVTYNVGDLDALLGEVVALVYERGRQAVLPPVEAAADPLEALVTFVRASLDFYVSHRSEMGALGAIHASGMLDRAGSPLHVREHDDTVRLVESGQRDGLLSPGDPHLLADAVRALLDVGARRAASDEAHDDVRHDLESLVRRMLTPG